MSEHKEGGERPRFQLEVKNRFIVEGPRSGTSLDNNVVEMNAESIATLGVSSHIALARRALMNFVLQEGDEEVFEGDIVVLRGKMKRKMYCVVLVNDDISNGEIICNDVVRKNLKARLGDRITVRPVDSAPSAQKVTIARIEDDNDDESQVVGDYRQTVLLPYFAEMEDSGGRPVHVGQLFMVPKVSQGYLAAPPKVPTSDKEPWGVVKTRGATPTMIDYQMVSGGAK
ncbi:vcp [Symbiodinium sp. KB8]|nr:vcp [Symbiodinium sp. KB8]